MIKLFRQIFLQRFDTLGSVRCIVKCLPVKTNAPPFWPRRRASASSAPGTGSTAAV